MSIWPSLTKLAARLTRRGQRDTPQTSSTSPKEPRRMGAQVFEIPDGVRGFDCNATLDSAKLAAFHRIGYRVAIRYVPRVTRHPYDLTAKEAIAILEAGFGLMTVQHVANPGWSPSGSLGTLYGTRAAKESRDVGIPAGVTVWCDLEGVVRAIAASEVIAFCNNWHAEVARAGFVPGLYVGYDPGLTADQLYWKLRFTHFWAAYNLNKDQYPAVRGVQMQQGVEQPLAGIRFDPDVVRADAKGDRPTCIAREGWPEL